MTVPLEVLRESLLSGAPLKPNDGGCPKMRREMQTTWCGNNWLTSIREIMADYRILGKRRQHTQDLIGDIRTKDLIGDIANIAN